MKGVSQYEKVALRRKSAPREECTLHYHRKYR